MTDSETLDPAALQRLREWGGEKLLMEMVRLFLANSPVRMEQIRSGVARSDPAEVERAAHSLKSSAANVGAATLRVLSTELESAGAAGKLERVSEMLPALEEAYDRAIEALQAVEKGDGQ